MEYSFRQRAIVLIRTGTSVVLISSFISNILRVVSTLILTRLLDPSAYGVIGILISISFAITMLTDVGIFGYVVRNSNADDPAFLDRVWTLRLLRCFVLMCVFFILSPVIAWAFDKPVTAALMAYSLTFGFEGLSSMAFATSVRRQQLTRLAVLELTPQLLTLPLAIGLALWLRSYWALVISMIMVSLLQAIFSYVFFPGSRRRWNFSLNEARNLWVFGSAIGAASVIHLILMQADKIVLARLLTIDTFGLFTIAVTLVTIVRSVNGKLC